MFHKKICLFFLLMLSTQAFCQIKPSFTVVPLGVKGGDDESNLSAYMIAPVGSTNFICLDAGTIRYGIQKAVSNKVFKVKTDYVFKNYIKAYFISHPHLDHVTGMSINAPDDIEKNIYALPFCIDVLKDKYFNWESWANFASEGEKPTLNKYHYKPLDPAKESSIENTEMFVKPYLLSHSAPYQSTAFLVRSNTSYVIYFGDTGSDEIEKSDKLSLVWNDIAPLVKEKKLKAIFLEVSFPNEQPVGTLFGHLTPKLFLNEMTALSKLTGIDALKEVKLVITHIKPVGDNEKIIKKQLKELNTLNLNLVYPKQGKVIKL